MATFQLPQLLGSPGSLAWYACHPSTAGLSPTAQPLCQSSALGPFAVSNFPGLFFPHEPNGGLALPLSTQTFP